MTSPRSARKRWRTLIAGLLGFLAVVMIFIGGLLVLSSRVAFQADFFAEHVAASLSDDRVASYVADKAADAVIAEAQDLIMVRPLIRATAKGMVASPSFRAAVRSGARQGHRLLTSSGGHEVLLSVSDLGVIFREALIGHPDLAEKIPDSVVAVVVNLGTGPVVAFSGELVRKGQRFGSRPRLVFWLGMALLAASILIANQRETALLRAGVGIIVVCAVVLMVLEAIPLLLPRLITDRALGQALAGVAATFIAGLWPRVLMLGAVGLLSVAASTAFLETFSLRTILPRLQQYVIGFAGNRGLRLIQSVVLILVGWFAVTNPALIAKILVVIGGSAVTFLGLRELCRLAVDPAKRLGRGIEEMEGDVKVVRRGRYLIAVASVLAICGVGYLIWRTPLPAPEHALGDGYNGLEELRDRPLDQVVFPCTHNAMAAADVAGWLFPNQQRGVRHQLEDGIRALMLDVVPGIPMDEAVKTDLDEAEIVREKLEPSLGAEGFEAALRIRGRLLGGDGDDRDLYLCHALCELGAIRLEPVLREIRDFLILNPNEVLIIIIEDAVPAVEVADVFERSGLVKMVYRGPVTPPWPTLGEMVDAGERVLVLAENDSENVPWIHPAFAVFQETPYHFESAEELSNAPNRGGAAGSLMLMNHWITSVPASLPSNAQQLNARAVLEPRIEEFRRERGRLPNVVAVDFYRTGDLIAVVRDLNQRTIAP